MKANAVRPFALLILLALSPLLMASDCGPMNYQSIRSAIKVARAPVPPIWSSDGRLVLYNKDAAMHWASADGSSSKSFPHASEPTLERTSFGCRGGGECPPPGKFEHVFDRSINDVILLNKLRDGGVDEPVFDIETMQFDGSGRKTLREGMYPSWSHDGTRIAFFNREGLYTMSADGSDLQEVVKDSAYMRHPGGGAARHGASPMWSPDNQRIAFLVRNTDRLFDEMVPRDMYVVHANGDNLTFIGKTMAEPAWSPDGQKLAYMQEEDSLSTIYTVQLDGQDTRAVISIPALPPQDINRRYAPRGRMAWSPDGSQIRVLMSPFITVNLDGTDLRIMIFPWDTLPEYQSEYPNFAAYASWSPDDTKIAVYILTDYGPLMPGLFTMTSDWMDQQILVNEFDPPSDVQLIKGLRWIDKDEYVLSLSPKDVSVEMNE